MSHQETILTGMSKAIFARQWQELQEDYGAILDEEELFESMGDKFNYTMNDAKALEKLIIKSTGKGLVELLEDRIRPEGFDIKDIPQQEIEAFGKDVAFKALGEHTDRTAALSEVGIDIPEFDYEPSSNEPDDIWFELYQPMTNKVNPGTGGYLVDNTNYMFNTMGQDLSEVVKVSDNEPGKVWTLVEEDGIQAITAGLHRVNAIGYFITEKPAMHDFETYSMFDPEFDLDNELDEDNDEDIDSKPVSRHNRNNLEP